jgi:hypothetical protein
MARMHPEEIEGLEDATAGEKQVFRFLRHTARPDKDFIAWYEPTIGESGLEPDFILYGNSLGILVLEVKDWEIDQIGEASPHTFKFWTGDREETRTNPDRQAKGYVNEVIDLLKVHPEFHQGGGVHEGRLKIPEGRVVVFPHINRKDYLDRGLDRIIASERVLLTEDLEPVGEIGVDSTGEKFRARIAPAFPFPFNGLPGKEIQKLTALIYPVLMFEPPKRLGSCKERFHREVEALDEDQARAALSLKAGHQLIKGPPGSGKTLVLIHRCGMLQKYRPGMKRKRLVCYNIALASYLKRLLQEKGITLGLDGVQVFHFYELCQHILGMPVEFDNPDPGYYETILQLTQETLGNDPADGLTCDALLIDEGQDFPDDMLKILLATLRPGGDLVIALDPYQDLYRKESSWKSIGIEARGTRQLKRVYRNTREIERFSRRFIGEESQEAPQLELFQTNPSCSGPQPEILWFESQEKIEDYLIRDILDLLHRGEYRRSEIGILYDDKVYGADRFQYQGKEAPSRLYQRLETAGIPTKWVSEDVRAKEIFDITTDRVSLISIHSAKGLDFDLVYLVGVDRFIPTDETRDRLVRLLYVAITRAKYRLVIPYVEETEVTARFKACLSNP